MSIRTRTRVGLSAVAALALATGAALATAAPAAAAETVGDITWYGSADFGQESGGYPAGYDWFFGDPKDGDAGFTANGLEIATDAGERVQVLTNLAAAGPADAATFTSYVQAMQVLSSDTTWTFQLPVFGNGVGEFTTLRTGAGEQPSSPTATWTTSRPIFDSDGTTELYAANATATLADFAAALYAGDAPVILAAGFRIGEGDSGAVQGFAAAGHLSLFTPVVSRTITPNPVSPAEATTSGITFTGTGWFPGSTVYISIHSCGEEGEGEEGVELFFDASTVAGPDGTVSFTAVLEDAPIGEWCVYFDDDGWIYGWDGMPETTITIANVLPATGLEITAPIAGGIAFLVLGGLALVATRRVSRTEA